ncbi:hypothetical protein KQI63_00460 [bacterium]|nr:hypothetical protein [bacterium]
MAEKPQPKNAAPKGLDPKLVKLISGILNKFVTKMSAAFRDEAEKFGIEDVEIANELQHASQAFSNQAADAIEMISLGELTLADMRRVSGTLYLTNLSLRWILEQQTTTYQTILNEAPDNLGAKIQRARLLIDSGAVDEGFRELLTLIESHREFYPLLMTMGFVYLKVKKNLAYAMRYFEKAAKNPPRVERSHYRSLALHFLATCHEGQKRYKNALNTLLLAEKKHLDDSSLQYSISRLYAFLNEPGSAIIYFEKAMRVHPTFYSMALVDEAYHGIREDLEMKLREFNGIFQELTAEFGEDISTLMHIVEAYDLQSTSPSLRREIERMTALLPLIGKKCFTAYRTALLRFFMGLYPEILQDLQAAIMLKQKEMLREIRLKRIAVLKRRRRLRTLFAPLAALLSAGPIYLFQDPLLAASPVLFPLIEFLLPLLGGGLAVWIVLALLGGKAATSAHDMVQLKTLETARRNLEEMEKKLGLFWKNQVAHHVDEVPVWVDDSVQ